MNCDVDVWNHNPITYKVNPTVLIRDIQLIDIKVWINILINTKFKLTLKDCFDFEILHSLYIRRHDDNQCEIIL